jgi:pilus assembly protein TadC
MSMENYENCLDAEERWEKYIPLFIFPLLLPAFVLFGIPALIVLFLTKIFDRE